MRRALQAGIEIVTASRTPVQIRPQGASGSRVRVAGFSISLPVTRSASTSSLRHGRFGVIRSFTASSALRKKGGKGAGESSPSNEKGTADDPFDLSALEAELASVLERLKNALSSLRAGGRFNPETIENLRVQLDKSSSKTIKLGDLAQVIPKGRTAQVLIGEKDHVKPVSSAIQSSSLSLTPQPDPTGANPLLLIINIPPPTADSRRAVVAEATKAGEKAGTNIRDARGKQNKKLRKIEQSRSARPDDVRKASAQMEKAVEKANAEAKKLVESAKKVLGSG